MQSSEWRLNSIIGRTILVRLVALFALLATGLSLFFIQIDAFESIHAFSRKHEDWELDEYILVFFAVLLSLSIAALLMAFILGKRVLKEVREKIVIEDSLVQSRKMQSMGTLLGGIAHSVNNHLVPVLTLTRLVKSELPENSEEARHLGKVVQAATGAAEILKSVLTFTHREHSNTSDQCVIGDTVTAAMGLVATTIPSSIKFSHDIDSLQVAVGISKTELDISLFNMIGNSVDALEGMTGQITVSLYKVEKIPSEVINKSKSLTGALVCLKVSDNGVGMTEEQQHHMFDPFFTTKDVGKGTGLGLSETYGIVEKAGGAITVISSPGQGSEIAVYIPVKPTVNTMECEA